MKELERRLRVNDAVLKFLTVRIDEKLKWLEKRKKEREKRARASAAARRRLRRDARLPGAACSADAGDASASDRPRRCPDRPRGGVSHGGIKEADAGSAVAAAHRRRQGHRHGKKQYFRRKKLCRFCVEKIDDINYKDVKLLHAFIAERGKIIPRRISGVCAPHQRRLAEAIKQARNIALLPFAAPVLSGGDQHGSHSERRYRKAGHRGEVVKVAAGLCAQFPAAEAAGRGGDRIQQEDRRAGAPGASAQGSQAEGRGRGSGQAADRRDASRSRRRPARRISCSAR